MYKLIVRPLPLDDAFAGRESADDIAAAEGFAPHRRREFLAWRSRVRRELGSAVPISYDAHGAPCVDCGVHIGVSHSRRMVAVCIGDSPCAVDTEPLDRDFGRVRERYIAASESALSDDPRLSAALWCAKETLYKLGGRAGTDFLRDIRIESVDFASGRMAGTIHGGEEIRLAISYLDDNIVVSGEIGK